MQSYMVGNSACGFPRLVTALLLSVDITAIAAIETADMETDTAMEVEAIATPVTTLATVGATATGAIAAAGARPLPPIAEAAATTGTDQCTVCSL